MTFMKVVRLKDFVYFAVVYASLYNYAIFNLISLGCHCMSFSSLLLCFYCISLSFGH